MSIKVPISAALRETLRSCERWTWEDLGCPVCPSCRGYRGTATTGIGMLDCACSLDAPVPSTYLHPDEAPDTAPVEVSVIKVLWPDGPRMVTEERVLTWARDAWADTVEWSESDEPIVTPDNPPPETVEDAIELLHDAGLVTFARRETATGDGPPPYDAATATGMYDAW